MYNKPYLIKRITVVFVVFNFCSHLNAQDYKLDKVTLEDVENNIYSKDTSAYAVILYKSRQTYFETNKQGEWEVITKISKRVKILKKEGLKYCIEKIRLNKTREKRESINGIKVSVYNIKRGKLQRNKLKKENIIKAEISKDCIEVILKAPEIKAGSIVDFKYKIISPFYKISDLAIQENIPIKKYLANIKIPSCFIYNRLIIGTPKLMAKESERFIDFRTLSTKKHFEKVAGGGLRKVIKDSILQIKEHETRYKLMDVPAFTKRELDDKKYRFRIIYKFISANFQ